MDKNIDCHYLIVGQGLAGSILALELMKRKKSVFVIDKENKTSASRVAAGIINPITGKRLSKSWRLKECLPVARKLYRDMEKKFSIRIFKDFKILRLLKDEEEIQRLNKKEHLLEYQEFLKTRFKKEAFKKSLDDDYGSVVIKGGGALDTNRFLDRVKNYFISKNLLLNDDFNYDEILFCGGRVRYKNIQAEKILFCEGARALYNPYFKNLDFSLAKGEIVRLKLTLPFYNTIVNKGKWLLPSKDKNVYIAGANYNLSFKNETPTLKARNEIVSSIKKMVNTKNIELLSQTAGIRPSTSDTKPFIGIHKKYPQLGIFNGFGSKGVLMIPYFSKYFVDVLLNDRKEDKAVRIDR